MTTRWTMAAIQAKGLEIAETGRKISKTTPKSGRNEDKISKTLPSDPETDAPVGPIGGLKPRIYIGIDTGTKTGFAVWDSQDKKLLLLSTDPIHTAMNRVRVYFQEYGTRLLVRVEDARQRKWIPQESGRERLQGAGSVKRDAVIWEGFLKDLGARFEMVAPRDNMTKMGPAAFRQATGWDKRCSNHARDAAMLVFGF